MTDSPMDAFDARVTDLMTAYGDRSVGAYDAVAIARVAITQRPSLTHRLGLTLRVGRGVRLLLLAAVIAVLASAAAVAVGSPRPATLDSTIVLGPTGPEHTVYRIPGGPDFEVIIENRSDVTWLPWGLGLQEKDSLCHLIAGQGQPDPCTAGPHSTIALRPPGVIEDRYEIYFAPPGADWKTGIRVVVDVGAEP